MEQKIITEGINTIIIWWNPMASWGKKTYFSGNFLGENFQSWNYFWKNNTMRSYFWNNTLLALVINYRMWKYHT